MKVILLLLAAAAPATAAAQSTCCTGGTLPADAKIPMAAVKAIAPGSAQAAAIEAGKQALAQFNSSAAGTLNTAIAQGTVEIADLKGDLLDPSAVGKTDGNTISVKLNDNPTADDIAIRLEHELDHYLNGYAEGNRNGGILGDCDHFALTVQTMNRACALSCEPNHHVSCMTINTALSSLDVYYNLCLESGGSPPYPVAWPPSCCH